MNAIEHALMHVNSVIDRRLLETGFPRDNEWDLSTLEHRIRTKIIDRRVIPDLQIVGGQQMSIQISKCGQRVHNDGSLILTIKPNDLGNRQILYPMELMFTGSQGIGSNMNGYSGNSPMQNGYAKMLNGVNVFTVGDSNLVKIDSYTIWCRDVSAVSNTGFVNLMVSNDAELRNVDVRLFDVLSKLIEQAVKSHLYVQRFSQQSSNVFGGFAQNQYGEMVSEYSNAEELYQELKNKKWKTGSMMLDPARRQTCVHGICPT